MAETPGAGLTVFVAVVDATIVGVIGFGPDAEDAIAVHSMGVAVDLQGRGIGTELKRRALSECAARYGRVNVVSLVHRRNGAMRRVNTKLGVAADKDPEDGEYLFTAVAVEEELNDDS